MVNKNGQSNKHASYRDAYYEKGHWGLKIWQTILVILSWIVFSIPCYVTTMTYLAYLTDGRRGHYFWHYSEGFQELNFLVIFLTFAFGMIAVFCLTSSFIQTQRHKGLVEKWPMFNINENRRGYQRAEDFMTKRFGDEKKRQSVRYFVVTADKNLSKNQLKKVIHGEEDNH